LTLSIKLENEAAQYAELLTGEIVVVCVGMDFIIILL